MTPPGSKPTDKAGTPLPMSGVPSFVNATASLATTGSTPTTYTRRPTAPTASVAATVKVETAEAVGTPESCPAALSVSPAGRVPSETTNVADPAPPVATRLAA